MSTEYTKKKIVIIGDARVGKTSFVNQTKGMSTPEYYDATLGVNVSILRFVHHKVDVEVWDCAGDDRYQGLGCMYYLKSHGCIIMYNDEVSFAGAMYKWLKDYRSIREFEPVVMVANGIKITQGYKDICNALGVPLISSANTSEVWETILELITEEHR